MRAGPWLVICGVRSFDWAYRIRDGKQIVGRSPECAIRIDHRTVSRRHAEISFDGKTLQIADLRSINGTCLNGNAIARATFEVGDTIQVGAVALEVLAALQSIRPSGTDDEATEQSPADGQNPVEAVAELLSPTDGKVLKLILKGLPEKAVATRLKLSEQTVHWRIKRIYKSLGVHSRPELLTMLLKPDQQR